MHFTRVALLVGLVPIALSLHGCSGGMCGADGTGCALLQDGGAGDDDAGGTVLDGGSSAGDCAFPLTAYCASDCPTFDESVEKIKGDCGNPQYADAVHGTCGSDRYIDDNHGYGGGPTFFFDGSGVLIAVVVTDDYNAYCGGKSNVMVYGPVPDCSRIVPERLCPVPGKQAGGHP